MFAGWHLARHNSFKSKSSLHTQNINAMNMKVYSSTSVQLTLVFLSSLILGNENDANGNCKSIKLIQDFFYTYFPLSIVIQLLQIRSAKCTHFNVLIYKIPTCFRPHWPIMRECSCNMAYRLFCTAELPDHGQVRLETCRSSVN